MAGKEYYIGLIGFDRITRVLYRASTKFVRILSTCLKVSALTLGQTRRGCWCAVGGGEPLQ